MTATGFAPDWPAPPGVKAWQTTRGGGVSVGPYSSMNLALHVGDDAESVRANRAALRAELQLPAEPVWLEQVHGNRILDLDRNGAGAADNAGPADGAVTTGRGSVLVVMTADCLPILLCSRSGDAIGVVHAGWRGLAAGVVGHAVAAMNCDASESIAWMGPAIGRAAFEVGDEVREAFVSKDAAAAAAFEPNARGRWQADLYRLARSALVRAEVNDIYGRESCTFTGAEQFFSHRREAPCGRMATLIWREA